MWHKQKQIKDEDRVIKDPARSKQKTFDRAVNLLTYRPRSIRDLRERLLEKPWTNHEIVEDVIDKLKQYKYLDDHQFGKDFAASKLRQRPVGEKRLRMDLIRKKLDKETIDKVLGETFNEISEEDTIARAIAKRLRIKGSPENQADRKKFYDHLLRLGFGYDLVRDKMREII